MREGKAKIYTHSSQLFSVTVLGGIHACDSEPLYPDALETEFQGLSIPVLQKRCVSVLGHM